MRRLKLLQSLMDSLTQPLHFMAQEHAQSSHHYPIEEWGNTAYFSQVIKYITLINHPKSKTESYFEVFCP